MKTFDITTETESVDDFEFRGQQESVAIANDCVRVFRFRYLAGGVQNLPKYIITAIREAGYTPIYLGGTTYKYSVIGLKLTTADTERMALNSMYWVINNLPFIQGRAARAFDQFPELKTEFAPRLVALTMEANA